jgi:FkbM family methyltransferase
MQTYESELENISLIATNDSYCLIGINDLILYGAGIAAGIALAVCKRFNVQVIAICDKKASGFYNKSYVKLPIISPDELVLRYKDKRLLITSWQYEKEITEELVKIGFPAKNIISFVLPRRVSPKVFREEYLEKYKLAIHLYNDELSKKLILDTANSYVTSAPPIPNTTEKMYCIPQIKQMENSVIVDGGASNGDTARLFLDQMKGKIRKIYAFEPDTLLFNEALENLHNLPDIEIHNVGLSENDGESDFFSGGLVASGYNSRKFYLSDTELSSDASVGFRKEKRPTTSIDSFFGAYGRNIPTMIKLNVSGSEIDALNGARETIRKSKPLIAAAACYDIEAVYRLPELISNIRDDYTFILRKHGFGYYEIIFYAF